METTTLYFKQGSSDKVYSASIEPRDNKFVVNFTYGRRGTTLQSGTKTQSPVDYGEAKAIYDKLIREKMGKGYTVGESGEPYQNTDKANEVSGISCQLLNPIEESEVPSLIQNPAFAMQEKYDGRRLLIRKTTAGIDGINRNGLIVDLPSALVDDAESLPGSFILDGESIGDWFLAFDILLFDGQDIRSWKFRDRCVALMNLISIPFLRHIQFVETAFDRWSKAAMLERLKKENKEGVVFKNIRAPYVAGRPSTGGDQLKHKFYETASFIVSNVNAKRSVSLKLFDGTELVPVGNVTIPPNKEIPKRDEVVEVRYLYAYRGGSIYQPVYLGRREDVPAMECSMDQLKFKVEEQLA